MVDIAKLGFRADTAELATAKTRLEQLGPAADKAESAADKLGKRMGWAKDATGKWRNELGQFVTASDRMAAGLGKADQATAAFGSSLKSSLVVMAGFAAITAAGMGFSGVVTTLSEFEYEMSAVAAISKATGESLKRLRDTAKELGASTEFSATQGAQGLKLLAQAGYSVEQAIATIPSVLDLATTEAMDLATASDYVTSIMAGFGLAVEDAARTTDVLVYASNAANTGVGELAAGMKYVAPIARALGISIEDTAAAMGILSNAGLKGEQAGTMLQGVLAALANASGPAADEIERLGLTLGQLNPQTNSINDIVKTLAASGMDAASAFKIFGTEAAPAILALTANKDELAQLTGEMDKAGGTAKRVADYMRDNLKGSLSNLSSAVEAIVISMGEAGLTAVLRAVFDAMTAIALGVSAAIDGFSALMGSLNVLSPIVRLMSDNINLIYSAAIGTAAALTAYYIPAVVASIAGMARFVAVAVLMRGGFVGLAASVMGSVAALVTFQGALMATGLGAIAVAVGIVANEVLKLHDELGSLSAVWLVIKAVAAETWTRVAAGASFLVSAMAGIWAQIQLSFERMVMNIRTSWSGLLADLSAGAARIPKALGGGLAVGFIDEIKADVDASITASEGVVKRLEGQIETSAAAGAEAFKNMVAPLDFGKIKEEAKAAQDAIAGIAAPGSAPGVPPVVPNLPPPPDLGSGGGGGAEQVSALEALSDAYQKLVGPIEQARSALSALDEAKAMGLVTDEKYLSGIGKIEAAFLQAGGTAEQWSNQVYDSLGRLSEQFQRLVEPIEQARSAFEALEQAKQLGVITDETYLTNLGRIEEAFIKSGGTVQQWATVVSGETENVAEKLRDLGVQSLTDLGDQFIDLAVEGKASFGDMARSIIKDLLRIAWQMMVIRPLMASFGFSPAGTPLPAPAPTGFAKGGVFTNSVVSRPTAFQFASGGGFGLGEMGEAGPEAVVPLKRGPDGSLGIQMYRGDRDAGRATKPGQVELHIIEDEGFAARVQTISTDSAVQVVDRKTPSITRQSRDLTMRAMGKTKQGRPS